MGRYCFFNTGVEYKFWFGVQPSEDILKFGGTPTFVYEGDHKHTWSVIDRKRIENTLRNLEETLGLEKIDFEKYEKSVEGTYQLKDYLYTIVNETPLISRYILGCLIYHQLLYRLDLNCIYES